VLKNLSELRDEIISKARNGKITPEQAEEEAKAAGLPPFERQPTIGEFDPMTESRWPIVMVVAWIAWRDIQLVARQQPEYRSQSTWWCQREWLEPADGAEQITERRGWLGGVKPHLMITDSPYGVNYDPAWRKRAGVNLNARKLGKVANDDRADWREAWALFPGSVAYVWHAGRHTSEVQQSLEASGFDMRSQIIWAKDRFALSRGHYHWQHEPCWYAVRGTAGTNWSGDRKQSTLWNIKSRDDDGHGHGTQKPVECMRRPIENNSSPGQAVYEPFSGSGTTIIAAEMTGRSCHAIEIDPAYVDVALLRWQAFTGLKATLSQDGRSLAEVAAERAGGAAIAPGSAP
jgi:DNA modification methylase